MNNNPTISYPLNSRGFTLLEVIIALAILAVSILLLAETQGSAVLMSTDAERLYIATNLAEEKMMEAQLILEREGWGTSDIEEEGDFDDFGDEEFRQGSIDVDYDDDFFEDFHWAYTVRKIEMSLPTNFGDVTDSLSDNGYFGEMADTERMDDNQVDIADMGISGDMITEYLSSYIREVRVKVWWGDDPDAGNGIELLTHAVNPSGVVTEDAEGAEGGEETR